LIVHINVYQTIELIGISTVFPLKVICLKVFSKNEGEIHGTAEEIIKLLLCPLIKFNGKKLLMLPELWESKTNLSIYLITSK